MTSSSSEDIILSNHLKEVIPSSQQQNLTLEKDVSSFHNINQQDFNIDVNITSDFWYNNIGCNVIPANSRIKKTTLPSWKEWQNNPTLGEKYREWKKTGAFNKGVAVIAGTLWRGPYKDKYLVCIDCDNKRGIEELILHCFPEIKTLEELAQITIVEQHLDNKDKSHVYVVVEKPLKNRGSINGTSERDESTPIIEVKSEGKSYVICSPSIHEDGCRYEIIGAKTPLFLNAEQSEKLEDSLNQIHKKYGSTSVENNNGSIPVSELFKDSFIVPQGSRHFQLLRVMCSLLRKYKNRQSIDQIKNLSSDWNQMHCSPPLNSKEFEKQWKCAIKYSENNRLINLAPERRGLIEKRSMILRQFFIMPILFQKE